MLATDMRKITRHRTRARQSHGYCDLVQGFTLIELLVTLAILATLASLVIPIAQVQMQRSKEQELRIALREIRSAIDAYKKAGDEGRIRRDAASTGYPKDLSISVEGVDDQRDPKRRKLYFLRQLPRDPFHDDPNTPEADTWAKRSYASEPTEPLEGDDVYDVRSRSVLIGLNGIPLKKW
jgi:general secretion pathway protein G